MIYEGEKLTDMLKDARPVQLLSGQSGVMEKAMRDMGVEAWTPLAPSAPSSWHPLLEGHSPS